MEFPTINSVNDLAKPRDGACAFVARSEVELRTYLAAEIAAARCAPAPVCRFDLDGDDEEELVEPASVRPCS